MTDEAAAHLKRAEQALRAARMLLRANVVEDGISRAYYAMFHAAKAALADVGEHPKTHSGTYDRFWIRFIKTERVHERFGKLFAQAQGMRTKADYDVFNIHDAMAARDLLRDAEAFCQAVETLIEDLAEGNV